MKIAISGASGLIGSALKAHLVQQGHEVNEITRRKGKKGSIYWNLRDGYIDKAALQGHDVIIHLAGANISAQSWSAPYKREIIDSRVKGTKILVDAIRSMNVRPKIFLCASAIGYYGNHEENVKLDERSLAGKGFLAQVCREWETASSDLVLFGVRVIHMRFGVVLSKKGGALAKMLPAFYFGMGGRLGHGRQKMSWIALDEIPLIVDFIFNNVDKSGPINFVTPFPVSNKDFTKTLGSVIRRPTIFPVPAFAIRSFFGEMGQSLLLEGAHVEPEVLVKSGYKFRYPTIKGALEHVLSRFSS